MRELHSYTGRHFYDKCPRPTSARSIHATWGPPFSRTLYTPGAGVRREEEGARAIRPESGKPAKRDEREEEGGSFRLGFRDLGVACRQQSSPIDSDIDASLTRHPIMRRPGPSCCGRAREALAAPVRQIVDCRLTTGSLSHLRTLLPKSSSCPQPAQRPNHAT